MRHDAAREPTRSTTRTAPRGVRARHRPVIAGDPGALPSEPQRDEPLFSMGPERCIRVRQFGKSEPWISMRLEIAQLPSAILRDPGGMMSRRAGLRYAGSGPQDDLTPLVAHPR